LLFNEADAILSKRGTVKDRGDHYENAIQNLLLQQLEDFDGIFMGTTNLSDNLDAAFQRRILFKVHFKKPVDQVRIALFQNAFTEIAAAEMEQFALTYNMTGSEIMNVKKKLTIEEVLNDGVSVVELLHHLCQEELSMQPGQIRKSIGFKRA
jgi:SpoVK/Ycf46/Vps4 family AAA+-type ATPase